MSIFILTFVIATNTGMASLSQEYATEKDCEAARTVLREHLTTARVILLACTRKGSGSEGNRAPESVPANDDVRIAQLSMPDARRYLDVRILYQAVLKELGPGFLSAPYEKRSADSYVAPHGCLTKPCMPNHGGSHANQYISFPEPATYPVCKETTCHREPA